MGIHVKRFPNITLSTVTSSFSSVLRDFGDCRNLALYVTSATGAFTGTVQVEPSTGGSAWVDLQSGGADVTVTASEGLVIEPVPFGQLRFLATGTTGTTTIQVSGAFVV